MLHKFQSLTSNNLIKCCLKDEKIQALVQAFKFEKPVSLQSQTKFLR